MNITSNIDNNSEIEADVVRASYKWSLNHWSLLFDHYKNGIESPEFKIIQPEEHKCVLKFKPNSIGTVSNSRHNQTSPYAVMEVEFLSVFKFYCMQATVSFVNKKMKKLKTEKSANSKSVESPLRVCFNEVVTETSVAQYLQDDTLILFFELYIVKTINASPVRTSTCTSNFSPIGRDKLKDMFETSQLCDVTFKVQDETLFAHKLVLAANSEAFRAMFTTKMKEQKEGTVEIEDVDAKVFKIFLRYMYTGEVEDIGEVITELIVVANKYQVIDLLKLCETYMSTHLQIANATEYLLTAHRLHCLTLEEEAVKFMKSNTKILADAAEYKLLSDYPSLIARIFD